MIEFKQMRMNAQGKLVEVDKTKNSDLERGQIVRWGGNMGWPPESFLLTGMVSSDFGTHYKAISLKDFRKRTINCTSIRSRDDPEVWHDQHFFIEKEKYTESLISKTELRANELEKEENEKEEKARLRREEITAKGKELFHKHIPDEAVSLIVATLVEDVSDSMVDYFATSAKREVIIGWSKHHRKLFPEMRKACKNFKPVNCFVKKPDVDGNGEKRTEENKDWWEARDEHRENYSMGHGTYLKASGRYSNGWEISKYGIKNSYSKEISDRWYYSMGLTCIFEEGGAEK